MFSVLKNVNLISHDESQNQPCCSKTLDILSTTTTSTYSREEIMSDSFNQLYVIILKIIINRNFKIIIYYIKMCILIFEQSDECIDFTVIYFYLFILFFYICVCVVYIIKFSIFFVFIY